MAKKRTKDKDASPDRVSKKQRVSGKKKDGGKESDDIAVPVLAGKTGDSARGKATRGDKSAEFGSLGTPYLMRPVPYFPAMSVPPHTAAKYVSPPVHSRSMDRASAFTAEGFISFASHVCGFEQYSGCVFTRKRCVTIC